MTGWRIDLCPRCRGKGWLPKRERFMNTATTIYAAGKTTRLGMIAAAGNFVVAGIEEGAWLKIVGGVALAAISVVWSIFHDKSIAAK